MSDKELIQALRPMVLRDKFQCLGCKHEHRCSTHGCAILKHALERLEQLTEPESNNPLTLEELREMDGEPIYLDLGDGSGWVLLRVQQGKVFVTHKNTICAPVNILFECGGRAYRRRPEEGTV